MLMNGNFIQGLVGVSQGLKALKQELVLVNVEVLSLNDVTYIVKQGCILFMNAIVDTRGK
jgi:hypothetical protein